MTICRSMNLIYEADDGTVSFQIVQGHAWNPQEALVLHAPQFQPPPPQYHYGPRENLMCTRNTYNLASNTYARVGAIERNISDMQDDIGNIREYMGGNGRGDDDEDEDMD
ncbi:hypothetical protein Hanom_Chr10g00949061 [Helianthus anomalus]